MNLGEIYTHLHALIGKEIEGNTFKPDSFNVALPAVNIEQFKEEYDMLEKQAKAQGKKLYDLLFTGSPLRVFTEISTVTSDLNGYILLSALTNFEYPISAIVYHESIYKDVEFVDLPEGNYRRVFLDGMELNEHPIAVLLKDRIRVYPTNVAVATNALDVVYLRMPTTPFFDYYIKTSTGKVYYLPPLYRVVQAGPTFNVRNPMGVTIDTGVLAPNNITLAAQYDSQSVELEWKESYHNVIINKLLFNFGVPIRDPFITQASNKQ